MAEQRGHTDMDAETIEALKGSIHKWERVVADGVDGTKWIDCPLCKMFFRYECEGCPVRIATGKTTCLDSPFKDYETALDRAARDYKDGSVVKAAQAELDFLRSLLPRDSKTDESGVRP